jgi:hypothetical protein
LVELLARKVSRVILAQLDLQVALEMVALPGLQALLVQQVQLLLDQLALRESALKRKVSTTRSQSLLKMLVQLLERLVTFTLFMKKTLSISIQQRMAGLRLER